MRRSPSRRRRTSMKRIVLSLLVLIAVGIAGAGGVALWGMTAVQAPGPLSEPTSVVIEHGQPTTEIGAVLEQKGVVSDDRLFVLTAYLTRASRGDLKAGEYEFPAGASLAQVLSILRSGRAVVHKVTVPEGWTSAQVVERINAHSALTGSVSEIPPEGSLLPDTYVFQRGLEREVLIARMRDAQARVVEELWSKRAPDLPIQTKEEAVILASIVEKETSLAEERQQVAAVFINRLRRKMRLQSDPTIIYGITGGERRLDRPIRRSDISEDTPYNTYRIDGLPPTPIANPGRESLAAVLQPDTTDHLYFVADGSGGHAFAKTLTEHTKNVRRWRDIEQAAVSEPSQAGDEAPESATDEADETNEADHGNVEAAVPEDAYIPLADETASGEAKPDELIAAAAASEDASDPEKPTQPSTELPGDAQAPAEPATPEAEAEAEAESESESEAEAEAEPQPRVEPQPMPKPKPEAATPQPGPEPDAETQAETGLAATLAQRSIPIPMPKPQQ